MKIQIHKVPLKNKNPVENFLLPRMFARKSSYYSVDEVIDVYKLIDTVISWLSQWFWVVLTIFVIF